MSDANKFHAELTELNRRKEQRQRDTEADSKTREAIKVEIYKVALKTAVGVPGAVAVRDSFFRPCHPAVRGKYGTLEKVNRTRCTIDIDGEKWDIPVKDIVFKDDSLFSIACKAAGLNPDGGIPDA
jgi:hypothetical protein